MKLRNLLAMLLISLIALSPGWTHPGLSASSRPSRPDGFALKPVRSTEPLRVSTMLIEPFVFRDGNGLRGYSVDVWDQVARRLNLKYEWVIHDTIDEMLGSVKAGQADLAIAAISMTPQRDAILDFTYPYFDSGLQIMVRQHPRLSFFQGISLVSIPFLLEVLLMGVLAGVLMAHMIWLVERRSNPSFPRGYFAGVWEGLWWLQSIVANGVYHDSETKSVIRRLMTVTFWIFGVAIIAEFTATLTSALTIHQLTSSISSPADLPGYRLATLSDSTAAEFLEDHNLDFTGVDLIETAYQLLDDQDVDAIVFDAPVLLYYAAHQGNNRVAVPGKIFHLEKYGLALPESAALREDLNRVLLELYQDGTLEALQQKWFGP